MAAMNRLVFGAVIVLAILAPDWPQPAAASPAMANQAAAPPAAPAPKPAAPAPKPDEVDRLLGPIALYPDALLGQVLLCATEPATVGALAEWLSSQKAKGTALQDAAKASGFDESFVAIVLFPDVALRMAEQIDWTTRVGQAFKADQSAVFASIQRLRAKARDAGKLKDTPQQDVETRTTSSGQQVIVIEPTNPQVVYVPQYNPQTVYTTSTVVVEDDDDTAEMVAAGLIGFTAGIAIGAAFDNDYYYGPYGMRGGFYMYDDAWDDWYDHREDAREDWMDHREDIAEERGDVARNAQNERTERTQARQEGRSDTQGQRTERTEARQQGGTGTQAQAQGQARTAGTQARTPTTSSASRSSAEARGYQGSATKSGTTPTRSGTKSDAFSGYSSGRSERAASSRGQRSRSSSRGGRGR